MSHRHELAVCRCGTVVRDCGCRLRPVYARTCNACRDALELLGEEAQACGLAYDLEVGLD